MWNWRGSEHIYIYKHLGVQQKCLQYLIMWFAVTWYIVLLTLAQQRKWNGSFNSVHYIVNYLVNEFEVVLVMGNVILRCALIAFLFWTGWHYVTHSVSSYYACYIISVVLYLIDWCSNSRYGSREIERHLIKILRILICQVYIIYMLHWCSSVKSRSTLLNENKYITLQCV